MENDLISRRAAIDEIDEWIKAFRENGHKESAADACLIQDGIIQLPSAQPEIIRCKDCKFWKKYGYINGKPEFLPKCGFNQIYTSKDDFCSRAERKNNG